MFTSHISINWVESLAEQELSVYHGKRSSIDLFSARDRILAVETAVFVRELSLHAEAMVRLFNQRVGCSELELRLQRESEGEGFSVLRNSLTLSLKTARPGVIHFLCHKPITTEPELKMSVMFSGTVEAKFTIFEVLEWHFLGSPITAEQVARHYLTEFIQVSRL